jgi:hypothetical protein
MWLRPACGGRTRIGTREFRMSALTHARKRETSFSQLIIGDTRMSTCTRSFLHLRAMPVSSQFKHSPACAYNPIRPAARIWGSTNPTGNLKVLGNTFQAVVNDSGILQEDSHSTRRSSPVQAQLCISIPYRTRSPMPMTPTELKYINCSMSTV